MKNKHYVIRLGGSLISAEAGKINHDYLKSFRDFLLKRHQESGDSFVIICGGGRQCRSYQQGAKDLNPEITKTDLDWIGIFTNNLHAQVVRTIFPEALTHEKVITSLENAKGVNTPFVVVGAEAPGHSSNYDAVEIAQYLGANSIVNLSNVEHVYDSDPRINPEAKKYDKLTWKEYLEFIPADWQPGLSTPFDPVSSRRARELGLEVVFMKGDDLENFNNFLNTGEFKGSLIKD